MDFTPKYAERAADMNVIETTELLKNEFVNFLKEAPVVIPEEGTIAGFSRLNEKEVRMPDSVKDVWPYDNLHFSMGTTFLDYGFAGVARQAQKAIKPDMAPEYRANLEAISEAYDAVCLYIGRHADEVKKRMETAKKEQLCRLELMYETLLQLAVGEPKTFRQALQAFYFAWKMRGFSSSSTMGRLDQYLYPFYRADVEKGIETPESVLELICEFWRLVNKTASGDTLMNAMLGGQTVQGEDMTNDLSVLMMKATESVGMAEPHVNYRYHKNTRKDLLDAAARVQLQGGGQATMYNDEVIIPALIEAGVPRELAYDYTNDGCTEIIIDQKSTIFFETFDIVKCFEMAFFNGNPPPLPGEANVELWTKNAPVKEWKTMLEEGYSSGDMTQMTSFEECFDAFKKQFSYQVRRSLKGLVRQYHRSCEQEAAPPFLNGSYKETLFTGMDCHRNGLPMKCVTMFAGSIPTAADCLAAIKETVFEKKLFTIGELQQAVAANFEGYETTRQRLLRAPKFGNDIDSVDDIAADIGNLFCDLVKEASEESGLIIWPALLGWTFVQEAYFTGATPDGRRWKDPISEHYSPTPGRATNGPTAIMCSCGKGPLKRAFGTAPVQLSLSRSVLPANEQGLETVKALTRAAVKKEFVMLNIAAYDVETLKKAQKNPEQYEDVIVRVWGYSARFVDLSESMQNHVIARVANNG